MLKDDRLLSWILRHAIAYSSSAYVHVMEKVGVVIKVWRRNKAWIFPLFLAATGVLSPLPVDAQQHGQEVVTYDTAQRLVCERNGKVRVDRPVVFQLEVTKYPGGEQYTYREGRIGGRQQTFAINPNEFTCTVSPVEGPKAELVREFEGLHYFGCVDNGVLVVRPLWVDRIIERGSDRALVYDYWIANGPPSKQTVMLSVDGGFCDIRAQD